MLPAICWKSFHCFGKNLWIKLLCDIDFFVSLGRKIDTENQGRCILLWMQQHWHQVATISKRSLPLLIISNWKYFMVSFFRLVIDSFYVFVKTFLAQIIDWPRFDASHYPNQSLELMRVLINRYLCIVKLANLVMHSSARWDVPGVTLVIWWGGIITAVWEDQTLSSIPRYHRP